MLVCREWFRAQVYVKVGVGALHRGNGETKQNANKEVVNSRKNWLWCCGYARNRREGKGKKTAVEKHI